MKRIIICLVCLFLLTGCYNYKEIESLAVVSTMVIDYKDGNYHLLLEIGKIEDKENTAYHLETSGKTIKQAIENTNKRFNKTLYFANMDFLLLSKNTLDHLDSIIKYINQDMSFSYNFNIGISNNHQALFEYAQNYEKILGVFMRQVLRNDLNTEYDITYLTFLKNYINDKIIKIPVISTKEEQIKINIIEVNYE